MFYQPTRSPDLTLIFATVVFSGNCSSITYLTGTKDQVAKAAKAYRVYFSKTEEHEEGEDYLVDHSIVIYLIAPNGEFLDFFTQRTTVSSET